jgi:hypothetical protein
VERWRDLGLVQIITGLAVVVFAVVLVGLEKESGELDWVGIITAFAGAVVALTGLYTLLHNRHGRPTSLGT